MKAADDRVDELDLHAVADAANDLQMADYEINGLRFALDALAKEGA